MIKMKRIINPRFDATLAKIVSYITFDGHLAQDLKCFYLSSSDESALDDFKKLAYKKFKVSGRLEEGMGYGKSYKYRVFSRDVCRFLESAGAPKGDKVKKAFLVPSWIKENKEFARGYVRVAFDCEGSIWFEGKAKIRFGVCKIEELIDNGFQFTDGIKSILSQFGIESTKTWLMKGNLRKDGKTTKGLYFKIRQNSITRFSKEIGFSNRFKKDRLSNLNGID